MTCNKIIKIVLVAAIVLAILFVITTRSARMVELGRAPTRPAELCLNNLVEVMSLLKDYVGSGDTYPSSLTSLAELTTNSDVFVCPVTGHLPGAMTNVDDWTDFIYIGNQREGRDWKVAMVVCPPENHQGQFGHIAWRGGIAVRLPQEQVRSLIREPWLLATNLALEEITNMKREIRIHIPKRLQTSYQSGASSKDGSEGAKKEAQ